MSISAENVIGGIVIGGREAYWRVADILTYDDFPTPYLGKVYRVCGEIARSGAELDVVSVMEECDRQGFKADVIELAKNTAGFGNIRGHAERVKENAISRRVKAICAEGAKSGDIADVQGQLTALLTAQPANAAHVSEVMKRMWADVMARHAAGDELAGLATGFPEIDDLTGGLQPGRVYGIGARAKMGKTILAMNICANVALAGIPTAVWSLEMSDEELLQRMSCAVAGVPSVVMQRPKLLDSIDSAMPKLHAATARLRDAPLWISDRTDVTIEHIEAQARQMHAAGRLSLLCIDYLGLLRLPKMDRHDLAIAHVTRRVKIIAKELRIPVILVFQLNRGSEHGQQIRVPRPSDARDSGSIEQDLDVMFLLHRPSYYDKGARPGLRLELALQRNGPTGVIELEDQLFQCRFVPTGREWLDAKSKASGGFDED